MVHAMTNVETHIVSNIHVYAILVDLMILTLDDL